MNIYENEFDVADKKYCGVGLGNFDGLHRGHMTLINTLLRVPFMTFILLFIHLRSILNTS